ncbi:MAG: lipase family protein [Leptospiraceae bacterium]|nr:hypothetical protein [Leptospiraceae bacterium]MCK6380552.1 lipase family protein [Leptospiraceae bacterium]NUM41803.1 hypothetical protein [Leptospiraceae bacterium]
MISNSKYFIFLFKVATLSILVSYCNAIPDNKQKSKDKENLSNLIGCYFGCAFIPGPLVDYTNLDSQKRGRLISSQDLIRVDSFQLRLGVNSFLGAGSQYNLNIQNGATMHEIVYETIDTSGSLIRASGAVWIPWKNTALPIISYNHGTEIGFNTIWRLSGAVFSANGFITLVPDYIGYGKTNFLQHPYLHAATLASSTIDMIRAIKKFCEYNKIPLNEKIFLTGYSEGGMASLSTLKELTNNPIYNLKITASSPGSGPYDLSTTATNIIKPSNPLLSNVNVYISFVLGAYNSIYKINRPLSDYFSESVAQIFSTGIFQREDGYEITKNLPKNTDSLLNPKFVSDYSGAGETGLKNYISENNTYNFTPNVPVKLFACEGDKDVPPLNSETAYNYFIGQGAKNIEKEIGPLSWGGHGNCSIPITLKTIEYFQKF